MIAHIFADRCTRCGDCATACPTHVFDLSKDGAPEIARLDQCQSCFMCELYCAADAIYVAPEQRTPEVVDPAAVLASGQLGKLRHDYGWDRAPDDQLADFWRLGPLLREGAEIAARRYQAREHGGVGSTE